MQTKTDPNKPDSGETGAATETRPDPERFDEYDFGCCKGDYGPLQTTPEQQKFYDEVKAKRRAQVNSKPEPDGDEGKPGKGDKDGDEGGNA